MQRLSVLLIAATMATAAHGQQENWQIEFVADQVTKPEVRVDSQGRSHMAYMLESLTGGVYYSVRDDDGDWIRNTIADGYFYAPLDLTIDDDDVIHVAYHDHDHEDIVYATGSDDDWALEVIADDSHDGWDGRIAVDPAGDIHIVSIDPSQFGSTSGVEWATRRNGTWQVEEIGSGPIPYEFGISMALSDDGRLHVAYHDGDMSLNTTGPGADLVYAVLSDGQWQLEPVDTDGDVGKFPSIALDSADRPHISYLDRTTQTAGRLKYAFHDGDQWRVEVVDELNNLEIAFLGARRTTAVAMDDEDNAYVAYSDKSVLRFAKKMENGWAIEDVTGPMADDHELAQFVSLEVEGNGRPHMAFYETVNGAQSPSGRVYYAVGPDVVVEPTAIVEETKMTPDSFELGQNYPNPFNPNTVIPYSLTANTVVEIAVYDLAGQLVRELTQGIQQAGFYEIQWDGRDKAGRDTASGVYSIRMQAGGLNQVRKMLLLR